MLGDAVDVLLAREAAERFIAEVSGDEPELAAHLRIEERELDGDSGPNERLDVKFATSEPIRRLDTWNPRLPQRFGVGDWSRKGVIVVSIRHASPVHVRRPRINPWLVAVIALAVGLVALSTWTVVDRTATSEPAPAQIVDELNAAVNAGDTEAVRALFAPDAVFQVSTGEQIAGRQNVVNAALIPHGVGFRIERVAPVTTEGNAAATFIKYSNGSESIELTVFQFKDGKIVRQWVYDKGYR